MKNSVKSSDIKCSPQRINGTIKDKRKTDAGNYIGVISDGKNEYHFNAKAFIDNDYQIDNAEIGDLVSFVSTTTTDNRRMAKDIIFNKKEELHETDIKQGNKENAKEIEVNEEGLISFFVPGYHYKIKDDMDSYFANAKMTKPERDIVDKFSRILRVSSIMYQFYGNKGTVYPFCILGATENLKEYIRGKYEFLLVFSCFPNEDWQQVTLSVHKAIRNKPEVKGRPLPNFYLLISNARNLLYEIDTRVKGGPDAAIIPFTVNELLSCEDDSSLLQLIRNRFSEYYFANNMLSDGSTIEEDKLLFGDRGKIADSIVQRCLNKEYSGIFGLRRSGKSSVLHAVFRRLDNQKIKYAIIESRKIESDSSWKRSLYKIAREVRRSCLTIEKEKFDALSRQEQNKLLELNSTEDDYEKDAVEFFIEDVKKYTRDENAFVIAFDEVEVITYNTATSPMWQDLNSYKNFWFALRESGCALIICGVNPTINEESFIEFKGKECDNPMWERIENCSGKSQTYLPTFTDEQTKEMINTLGGYSNIGFDDVYVDINRAFGGQPYAIRQFCSFAYEEVRELCKTPQKYQLSLPACKQLLATFNQSSHGEKLISTILEYIRIYKNEYNTLKKIAFSPEKYKSFDSNSKRDIDHLVKYGILAYDNNIEYVTFRIESVKDYLLRSESKDPEDMNNEERRRYVQDAVANCEKSLKRHVLNTLNISVSDAQARQMIYNPIPKYSIAILRKEYEGKVDTNNCLIRDFFDHKVFEMYFSKLKRLIKDNWTIFGTAFEKCSINKDRFVTYMDDLNAGRTDADHYDAQDMTSPEGDWEIDDNTLAKFRVAADEINKFFYQVGL